MQAPISAFGMLVEGWKRPDDIVELKVRVSEVETTPNKKEVSQWMLKSWNSRQLTQYRLLTSNSKTKIESDCKLE